MGLENFRKLEKLIKLWRYFGFFDQFLRVNEDYGFGDTGPFAFEKVDFKNTFRMYQLTKNNLIYDLHNALNNIFGQLFHDNESFTYFLVLINCQSLSSYATNQLVLAGLEP